MLPEPPSGSSTTNSVIEIGPFAFILPPVVPLKAADLKERVEPIW